MRYTIQPRKDLRRNPYKGRYYAFEGIDGSGKSTQVEKVKSYIENKGEKVVLTSEPQKEGIIQKVIRDTLFAKIKIPSRAYQDLYSADRELNHSEVVVPALKRGEIVLTHRSIWSNVPYGLLDLGSEYDFSNMGSILVSSGIISEYHQFLAPDKTFYLKVSARHATERLKGMEKTKDIYEKEEKLAKIVTGYERIVKEFPEEFVVIDGEKSEEEVFSQIIAHLIF